MSICIRIIDAVDFWCTCDFVVNTQVCQVQEHTFVTHQCLLRGFNDKVQYLILVYRGGVPDQYYSSQIQKELDRFIYVMAFEIIRYTIKPNMHL